MSHGPSAMFTLSQAQANFQAAVQTSLEKLESEGKTKSQAVAILLARISPSSATLDGSSDTPTLFNIDEAKVSSIVSSRNVSREDAVRAVIVFQELQSLRRSGLDTLAAVEELTRRMATNHQPTASNQKSDTDEAGKVTRGKKRGRNSPENHGVVKFEVNKRRTMQDESPIAQMVKRLKRLATLGETERVTPVHPLAKSSSKTTSDEDHHQTSTSSTSSSAQNTRSKRKNSAVEGATTRESKRSRRKK